MDTYLVNIDLILHLGKQLGALPDVAKLKCNTMCLVEAHLCPSETKNAGKVEVINSKFLLRDILMTSSPLRRSNSRTRRRGWTPRQVPC